MWTRPIARHHLVVILAVSLLMGCAAVEAPSLEGESAAAVATTTAAAAPEPQTVADLFPEGAGKALVLDNCSACHAVACSVIGQRPQARWNNLKVDHRDKASSLSEVDLDMLFAYLSEHFNDSQPAPSVPAHFLEQGCTPF